MKTIGLLLNSINSETSKLAGSVIKGAEEEGKNVNIFLFANRSLNFGELDICCMAIGTMSDFEGDVICFHPEDAKMALQVNRNINVKYLLTQDTCQEMVSLFEHADDIEFIVPNEAYLIFQNTVPQDKVQTLDEYFDDNR